ncbi:MAG: RNA methyltransferase [Candidatus Thermoplasmatota archaeon]|nr:RNA methyltransferase [Candidatus Thermoplasmatota archaeon]
MNKRILSKIELKERKKDYLSSLHEQLSSLSARISVILVHPKYQGNIGAIARLMKNNGLTDLRIVGGPQIENEAIYRAMNGKEILETATHYDSFEEAAKGFTVIAGTSSSPTYSDRKFLRLPTTPQEFWKTNLQGNKKIALAFGREDDGLRNTEIELCNAFMYIPANPEYPVYNLSHAVSIILYEMLNQLPESSPNIAETISEENFNLLMENAFELLDFINYPEYKRANAEVMIKKIASRSNLTESEFYKIMGVVRYLKYHVQDSAEKERDEVPPEH